MKAPVVPLAGDVDRNHRSMLPTWSGGVVPLAGDVDRNELV